MAKKTLSAYVTVTVKIKSFATTKELEKAFKLGKGQSIFYKFAEDQLNTIEFRHDGNTLGKINGKDYQIDYILLDDFQ